LSNTNPTNNQGWTWLYEVTYTEFLLVNLKSSVRKFYICHHDLADRYGISVSQMTKRTKPTNKTKDWVTPTPLTTRGELDCSGRVRSSSFTSGTHRVKLVTNPVISHEWGKCLRQMEHIRSHLWHRYSITVSQVVEVTVKLLNWWLQLN
jgi:hypothetical protein